MTETFGSLSGGIQEPRRLDGFIVSRTRSGRTLITPKPPFDPRLKFNGMKNSLQEEVRHAVTYAEFAWNQPLYQSKAVGTLQTAYNLAVEDYLGKPEVVEIDIRGWHHGKAGQTILVKARDNFLVLSVRLMVWNGYSLLEEGEAEQSTLDGHVWEYITKTPVARQPGICLEAFAYDLPGNVGKHAIQLC
jgi:hypothetical protein